MDVLIEGSESRIHQWEASASQAVSDDDAVVAEHMCVVKLQPVQDAFGLCWLEGLIKSGWRVRVPLVQDHDSYVPFLEELIDRVMQIQP